MSREIARTLTIAQSQAKTYLTAQTSNITLNGASWGVHCVILSSKNAWGYATVNDAGKNILFPNATAKAVAIESHMNIGKSLTVGAGQGFASVKIGTTWEWSFETERTSSVTGKVVNYEKTYFPSPIPRSTDISLNIRSSSNGYDILLGTEAYSEDIWIRLYFVQYDFSASAGTGIASATVDKSTGFDGDPITFTASVQSGYTWDGWYNGATKVSANQTYTHTVNGADLSLTAKAVPSTKRVTTKYNGTTIATENVVPPVAVSYNGAQIASIADGAAKILSCGGKLMSGNVVVGGKTLQCKDKIMSGDVLVIVGADINILASKTWSLSGVTLTDGVFSFATGATAMAQASLTKPIANHLYYGRVDERRMPECTNIADGRFEYFAGDGENRNMIFSSFAETPNDGEWHTKSRILSMSDPVDASYIMRNFVVSANGLCYRKNPVLVDLTALFGAGHEPDIAWCDANL